MPVLPDELTTASLPRRWRGYDRGQVEGLLRRVGADYGGAIERIAAVSDDHERARLERDDLRRQLDELTESARRDAELIRGDADSDAAAIRRRAEEASDSRLRQVDVLRLGAQRDADAARARLEDADRRARELEDAARDRWDALRADTEARIEQLHIAERRFADRVGRAEAALSDLRSQLALLDQVQQAEAALATIRAETYPSNGDEPGEVTRTRQR
jgi:DivIVA protein